MPASVPDRWRGRAAGLAVGLLIAGLFGAVVAASGGGTAPVERRLVLSDAGGRELTGVALPDDGRFTLRYRNSVYRSTAEERFTVNDAGELVLEELAADELAVLDEYYTALDTRRPGSGDAREFVGEPAQRVVLGELTLAATDRGRRTLLVEGHDPVELWRFVDDADPSVTMWVERSDG